MVLVAVSPRRPADWSTAVAAAPTSCNPVAWHEEGVTTVQLGWGASMTRWWIRLRCGQCGDVREVEVSDAEAKRFEQELERGVADIAAAVARIERDGAEALMAALRDP